MLGLAENRPRKPSTTKAIKELFIGHIAMYSITGS